MRSLPTQGVKVNILKSLSTVVLLCGMIFYTMLTIGNLPAKGDQINQQNTVNYYEGITHEQGNE